MVRKRAKTFQSNSINHFQIRKRIKIENMSESQIINESENESENENENESESENEN